MNIPNFTDILEAHKRIRNYIHRTPVLTCESINNITGCRLYFKCENFQKIGAFKFRGACNAVFSLSEEEIKNGVATHSSGNHAQALALAAKIRDIKSYIVMPDNSPKVKKEAVAGYGAEIIYCKPTLEAREYNLEELVKKTGAVFIHPYNNFNVICGQGTASIELLEQAPNPDIIIIPVGGGGLISGNSISVKALNREIRVIGVEPNDADDAARSMKAGYIIPSVNPKTIADGLLTSLSDLTFAIIKRNVSKIMTVNDETIVTAMKLVWERMKIVIEPSAAVTLAAVLENKEFFAGKKIGIIFSGGNVDLNKLPWNM